MQRSLFSNSKVFKKKLLLLPAKQTLAANLRKRLNIEIFVKNRDTKRQVRKTAIEKMHLCVSIIENFVLGIFMVLGMLCVRLGRNVMRSFKVFFFIFSYLCMYICMYVCWHRSCKYSWGKNT
jgi:hypothetical protein